MRVLLVALLLPNARKLSWTCVFALAAAAGAAGCLSGPDTRDAPDAPTKGTPTPATTTPPAIPTKTIPTPAKVDISGAGELVKANTRFAHEAFRALSNETPNENLVISPYSLSTALQMVYGGAGGTTQRAMVAALRLGNAAETVHEEASKLLDNLTASDPNVTVRIGNSLWIDEEFAPAVKPEYVDSIATGYRGDVYTEDFRDDATVELLNAWASNKTEGKIPKVLDRISGDEVMFLLNAVYFKGAWSNEFNASCTHTAPFTTDAGATVEVDMMCGGKHHTYTQDAERTIARLPYGEGRFAMYLVLPPAGTKLDAFVAGWDGDLTAERGYSSEVKLEMPRLKVRTSTLDVVPTLTGMGMGVAFTDQADFTRIAESLYLTRVIHDAVLEVDEKGTTAAAVTTVGVGVTSLPPPPLHLVFDRPFLVMLRDDASGTVLFLGKIHDPTAN